MLDARAAIFSVIFGLRKFVGVEGSANGIVADSVSEELQTAFIQFRDGGSVFFRIPEESTLDGRVIGVGFQKSGGVRFDDAIQHEFHGVGVNPFVVEFLARLLNRVKIFLARSSWRI